MARALRRGVWGGGSLRNADGRCHAELTVRRVCRHTSKRARPAGVCIIERCVRAMLKYVKNKARLTGPDWQRAAVKPTAVLLGRSSGWMNIGQPSHGGAKGLWRRRPLVEHGWPSGARVSRYPTAGSQGPQRSGQSPKITKATGWTRPRAGFAPMVS